MYGYSITHDWAGFRMSQDAPEGAHEKFRRRLLIAAGSVFLGLGAVGVVLPLLPTTPFLLLAAACYLRSSPRLHEWLVNSRVLGAYIRDYTSGRGIPTRAKVVSISLLWLTIGFSVVHVVDSLVVRVILLVIATAVTVHILTIRPSRR